VTVTLRWRTVGTRKRFVALLREFGWSRSVLAGAFSVFALVAGAVNPVVGGLGDRWGPRRVIMVGGGVLALALWAVSLITTPWQLYAAFGLATSAGVTTAGWTPAVILVQRQFTTGWDWRWASGSGSPGTSSVPARR
jgi:MFS family permease